MTSNQYVDTPSSIQPKCPWADYFLYYKITPFV